MKSIKTKMNVHFNQKYEPKTSAKLSHAFLIEQRDVKTDAHKSNTRQMTMDYR